jgi:HAMP domain-containing protein
MTFRLHWKLMLVTTIPVIAVITGIIWLAFDQLAADYFMVLMDKYMVSPTDTHRAFLTAVHRYLLWASLVALGVAFLLSYLLTRRVLRPLVQMSEASRQIAAGNFSARVEAIQADEIGELGRAFNRMSDSLERLEQLRALSLGMTIAVGIPEVPPGAGVDTADDLRRVALQLEAPEK